MGRDNGWVRVTEVANVAPREGREVRLNGVAIALFNLGGRFAAVENRCPHRGGPLADGIVSSLGGSVTVTCPLHNWRVCVDSGEVAKPADAHACVRSFPARVENGIVMVDMTAAALEEAA